MKSEYTNYLQARKEFYQNLNIMKPDSQLSRIKRALENGSKITPIDALMKFGCFRLSARIADLRESGMNIRTEMIEDNGKRFARYSMDI